jgi:hypothetical protein
MHINARTVMNHSLSLMIQPKRLVTALLAAAVMASSALPVQAQSGSSTVSEMSFFTASIIGASPVLLAAGVGSLVVKAVEVTAIGSVLVLERVSDGARISVQLGRNIAISVGTAVVSSVISTGVLLSAAGQVLAFVPSAVGSALLYNQRVTQ